MSYRKLGRTSNQCKAMLRDTTADLIINERVVTTETRVEEVRLTVEEMITLGKRGDLHAHRQAVTLVRNKAASVRGEGESVIVESALQRLLSDLGPRFAGCQDGYTRILRTKPKRGDAVPMVVIELVK